MSVRCWFEPADDTPFGIHNLPYGVFGPTVGGAAPTVGVRIGDHVLDLYRVAEADGQSARGEVFRRGSLNPLMAQGPDVWRAVRRWITGLLTDPARRASVEPHLVPVEAVRLHLPFEVGDYVDFYSSEHHATNLGQLLRPGTPPLTPNWKHLPIGYHGRSGTVRVSGEPVYRPHGQRRPDPEAPPVFGPTERLDIEAEVGFVVGRPSRPGRPVAVSDFASHVFGVVLVNDWSARDLQAFEYVPLGPFLGKSFATSVSPWVVPLDALREARVRPPRRDVPLQPYLADDPDDPWGLDLTLRVSLNGDRVSAPPFAGMYWTPAQQLAHLTANGATVRTGDLFASGTVSGPRADERGSLFELAWGGRDPLKLSDGTTRSFLLDGDEVTISATAPGPDGSLIGFGEVTAHIEASPPPDAG